jgi:hypothetical protein
MNFKFSESTPCITVGLPLQRHGRGKPHLNVHPTVFLLFIFVGCTVVFAVFAFCLKILRAKEKLVQIENVGFILYSFIHERIKVWISDPFLFTHNAVQLSAMLLKTKELHDAFV